MKIVRTVRHLMMRHEFQPWRLAPGDTVYDALHRMAEKNVGALPVLEDEQLVGIFSERDYARKVILRGRSSKELAVHEIMSTKIIYVRPGQTIDDCMALMDKFHIRHLPVLDDDQLVGMISMRDVVKDIISEQDFIIEQLVNYIHNESRAATPPAAAVEQVNSTP